jgi:hypothetical protein
VKTAATSNGKLADTNSKPADAYGFRAAAATAVDGRTSRAVFLQPKLSIS